VRQLEREKDELMRRLEFVEELVGPTEAQRKALQEQVIAARAAALRASHLGAGVPTKVAGRLDERLMHQQGLSERDAGLLQGGCLPDGDGILQDVSLLGDPQFRPYDESTGKWRWEACGGVLKLSLEEVQDRFGEEVARDVVRCARELDKYDASRRVGVELPWHEQEDRELEPAEVIDLMAERGLGLRKSALTYLPDIRDASVAHAEAGLHHDHHPSPYAAVHAPPRRGRGRQARGGRPQIALAAPGGAVGGLVRSARGNGGGMNGGPASAVVALPRLNAGRASIAAISAVYASGPSAAEARCAPRGGLFRQARGGVGAGGGNSPSQDHLVHPLLSCHDRGFRLI